MDDEIPLLILKLQYWIFSMKIDSTSKNTLLLFTQSVHNTFSKKISIAHSEEILGEVPLI